VPFIFCPWGFYVKRNEPTTYRPALVGIHIASAS
jgi:hypothetical protein